MPLDLLSVFDRSHTDMKCVKLFDGIAYLGPLNQPDGAEKAPISDHTDDFQHIANVIERVTVDQHKIRAGARCYASCLQAKTERFRGIDAGRSQYMFLIEAGARQGEEFGVDAYARWQPVSCTADDDR